MTLPSDVAQSQGDIMRRLADLEREVRELRAARSAEATAIGAGGITVKGGKIFVDEGGTIEVRHPNGDLLGMIGLLDVTMAGQPVYGAKFHRKGGTAAIAVYAPVAAVASFGAFQDHEGTVVVSTDGVSGRGLATPYIPGHFASWAVGGVPVDQTANAAYTVLQKAVWRKQHPRIQFSVLVQVTATTADMRWVIASGVDAGTVIGEVTGIGNGASWGNHGPFSLEGAHLSEFDIDLEGRVTTGVGVIGVRTLSAIGLQS